MDLTFVLPTREHKEVVWKYREDFFNRHENIDGGAGLQNAITFEEWLIKNEINRSEDTTENNLVPATTFLVFDKEYDVPTLVGMIDIRHRLNDYLLQFGGSIGYSVKYDLRNKGYAKSILKIALLKCKEFKMSRVLVTCDDENIASQKVIEYNGGVIENINEHDGIRTRRYWIDLL